MPFLINLIPKIYSKISSEIPDLDLTVNNLYQGKLADFDNDKWSMWFKLSFKYFKLKF